MEMAEEGVDCEELANRARERCQARKEELCTQDGIAKRAAPHDFIRGDVAFGDEQGGGFAGGQAIVQSTRQLGHGVAIDSTIHAGLAGEDRR